MKGRWIRLGPLKDMKEAFPVQTAEYAVANKIAEQPPLLRGSDTP
jgi:hypothetical protein